jgi:cell division protein ZapA
MPELTVMVCGQSTTIACAPEDEARLSYLIDLVGQRADGARSIVGDNDRWRQLLFAAIFLADELDSGDTGGTSSPASGAIADEQAVAERLSAVAARIGAALDRIEAAANST